MKATLALITCSLTALAASAKPDVYVPGPFVAGAWHTGGSSGVIFLGNPINASGNKFYINRATATYCPDGVSGLDCSQFSGTETVFTIGEGSSSLSLDVTVPGGQQVYVAPDGSLSFTQAHSAYIPPGSIINGFTREQTNEAGAGIYLYLLDHSFYLCPVTDESDPQLRTYQVFALATPRKNCEKTKIRTFVPLDEQVWQYT